MKTISIIILVLAAIAGAVWVGTKFFGLTKDNNKNGIPDEIEDAIDDIKNTVEKYKITVEEVKEVKEVEEVKEVNSTIEVTDLVSSIKGKVTKSKLTKLTKKQLVDSALVDFGVGFDLTMPKTTLVNKVYSIYNKKQLQSYS